MARISLNTNLASLGAQRRFSAHTAELARTFDRLSSGLRINRSADDAAGLAIADSLRADGRLLAQATRNINDGISLLNIADSTLAAQAEILIRMKELAEQGANGVLSGKQREALDLEYQALTKEFDRVGTTTSFNGIKLFEGSGTNVAVQAGIGSNVSSMIGEIIEASRTGIGTVGAGGNYDGVGGTSLIDLGLLGNLFGAPKTSEDLYSVLGTNALTSEVTDSSGNKRKLLTFFVLSDFSSNGNTAQISFYQLANGHYQSDGDGSLNSVPGLGNRTVIDSIQFSDTGTTAVQVLDFNGYEIIYTDPVTNARNTAIEFSGVDTQNRARDALTMLTARLEGVITQRGELGAIASRLEVALSLAGVSRENVISAESQIRDADVAVEAANVLRQSIRQQAAGAVLSQANQQPALAIRLLSR